MDLLRKLPHRTAREGNAHRPRHHSGMVLRSRRSAARRDGYQVALALADEIADLEEAGVAIIQVDEPALRELLPLRADAQP